MSDTEYKLTDAEIEELWGESNRGWSIERDEYFKAARDAEAATAAKYAERIAELQAKLDAVAVDAQRYRLLRLKVYIDPKELILRTRDVFLTRGATVPEMLDSALDAMRTGEPKV